MARLLGESYCHTPCEKSLLGRSTASAEQGMFAFSSTLFKAPVCITRTARMGHKHRTKTNFVRRGDLIRMQRGHKTSRLAMIAHYEDSQAAIRRTRAFTDGKTVPGTQSPFLPPLTAHLGVFSKAFRTTSHYVTEARRMPYTAHGPQGKRHYSQEVVGFGQSGESWMGVRMSGPVR